MFRERIFFFFHDLMKSEDFSRIAPIAQSPEVHHSNIDATKLWVIVYNFTEVFRISFNQTVDLSTLY